VLGVNNNGTSVGQYVDSAGGLHGFQKTGRALRTVVPPSAANLRNSATDVNDLGQVVGFFEPVA
jgi:hypothetical protein